MSQKQIIEAKIQNFKHHITLAHKRGDKAAVYNFNKAIRRLKKQLNKTAIKVVG